MKVALGKTPVGDLHQPDKRMEMGYYVSGFVAQERTFVEFRSLNKYVTVASLMQGFELLLCDGYLEKALGISESPLSERYKDLWLRQNMIEWVLGLSHRIPIAFILADFIGGNGQQSAALWHNGMLVLKPATNEMWMGSAYGHMGAPETPINSVLRMLGVKTQALQDEFEAIGLNQYRHNDEWFAAYTGFSVREYEPDE